MQGFRMHRIRIWTLAALGLLFTTVLGLLNHGNISTVPEGTGMGEVWKKLYELQAQVLKENGELIRNQTSLQTQMKDLKQENEELRRNQTLLIQENSKQQTQIDRTMIMVNDVKRDNEELKMNQTHLQLAATHLQAMITSLQNIVSATKPVTPVDVRLNLLNSTIQALHIVHSSTAAIVTSLQGKQNIMDGSIMSLNTSLRNLHGSVEIDVAALNCSLIQVNQHLKNLNINVTKNTNVLQSKVLFSAKMPGPLSNRVKNGILQYTTVITNVGGAYNPADSTFTAPIEGYYVFSWSTSQYNHHYTLSSIMKNGARILSESVYTYASGGQGDSTSEIVTLHLVQGDRVWIKLIQGNDPYVDSNKFGDINSFSGFLL